MGIRDFLDRLRNKKAKYKEFEEDMKVQEDYYEKKKSSNERELEKYIREEREKQIKKELDEWRDYRQKDGEYGHQILKVKNVFNGGATLLKEKKLFTGKSNLNTEGGLFFK